MPASLTYKQKLLEQLARVRWYGMRATARGFNYCVVCNDLWHGRRASFLDGQPIVYTEPYGGIPSVIFGYGRDPKRASLTLFERYGGLPGLGAKKTIRLHGQVYDVCLWCATRISGRRAYEPSSVPLNDLRIRLYAEEVYGK